jgi:HK97 family phage major capsid protein
VHRVTDPVFGKITIPVHTAMASMPIVNSMLEDSAFDVMGIANELIGEAYALGEDNVFINGTGVAQPLGILAEVDTNGPASVKSGTSSVLTTTGDAWTGLRINNIFYALPAQYRGRAAWLYNSTTAALVDNLVDTNKRPLVQDLYGGLTNGPISQIKGRPVYVDEFVPTPAASSNSVIWGDLSGYIIVDRVGLSIQRLSEIYAETDITLLLARKRVGGYLAEAYRVKVLQLGA